MPTKFNPFTGNLTPTPKPLSDSEIKEQYEANADTNAYTDAEKTKLAGVATGAEVNVQSDWEAVSGDAQILNKPTVYTTTNSATPPAGAIEGDTWWDSETGEKFIYYNDGDTLQWVQVSNTNNLVLADVGTAAYADVGDFIPSADSGNYVQTTGNQSIAGTKTFTTALILPNNSRINDVEHFYQITKPTTRGDSTALGIGDRWWKTDDGTEWFWNGTYWLSNKIYSLSYSTTDAGANSNQSGPVAFPFDWDVFILSTTIGGAIALAPQDSSNYWTFGWRLYYGNGALTTLSSLSSADLDLLTNQAYNYTLSHNLLFLKGLFADARLIKVGAPGNLRRMGMTLNYRRAFP